MKELLFKLATAYTLVALGGVFGYLWHQEVVLDRYQESLNAKPLRLGIEQVHYVATGDSITFKK